MTDLLRLDDDEQEGGEAFERGKDDRRSARSCQFFFLAPLPELAPAPEPGAWE
jgi:hypothetical protein